MPTNVVEAIRGERRDGRRRVLRAWNSAPGRKDPALIRAFVAAVRAAEAPPRRLAG